LNWGDVEEISVEMQRAHRVADPDDPVRVTIGELLRRTAARIPTRTALIEGAPDSKTRRRVSYSELLTVAEAGARDLLRRFPKDGNIAISASNSIDWIVLEFSAALAGLPLVMINPSLTGHEAEYILRQSTAITLFVGEDYRNNPLARRVWNEGALIVLPEVDGGLMLQLIEEENVAFFSAVATVYLRILDHADFGKRRLQSLDVLVCGGSTVPEELVRKIERSFGAEYMMMFDLTEMCGAVCQTVRGDTNFHKARTVGKPLPGIELKIVSVETGEITGVDEHGEICVRDAGRINEYFDMAEATALTIDKDGWLHTVSVRLRRSAATPSIAELKTFLREHIAQHKVPKFWEFVARQSKEGSNVH
jgi:acyl-CoA synthetase (AMP-forming)/AMP-acid ligase II